MVLFLRSYQQSAKKEEETSPEEKAAKALTDSLFFRFPVSFLDDWTEC
jgi:hypothetical protein